jgi:hypothetical protein
LTFTRGILATFARGWMDPSFDFFVFAFAFAAIAKGSLSAFALPRPLLPRGRPRFRPDPRPAMLLVHTQGARRRGGCSGRCRQSSRRGLLTPGVPTDR